MKYYILEGDEFLHEAIEAHCGNYFDTPEEAALEAPKGTSPGSKWYIVDEKGKTIIEGQT